MASKADRTIPDLANATPGFLLDEIAKMRIETSRLKFLDGVYKQALQARLTDDQRSGKETIHSDNNVGQYVKMSQVRVDADAVREKFKDEPDVLKELVKNVSYEQLNINPKEEG